MKRLVEIDPTAGFCFGVEKAIEMAEEHLDTDEAVYGLGHMVHNEAEISRLEELGLKTISVDDFEELSGSNVILRAHGEPPATYDLAAKNDITLIDATCPIVMSLQKRMKKMHESIDSEKEQIVLFGKTGHPETIGLLGQTQGTAVLITDQNDISGIDLSKSIHLFSQTTMDPVHFSVLEENIKKKTEVLESVRFESKCTICNQMKSRKPDLSKFARAYDAVVFVSGKASSNGAMLYRYCKSQNENSYWIHTVGDMQAEWIEGKEKIGVSGATSTPRWQLEKVKRYLESL